ncbi:hypothetical protein FRIGORI9N_40066 [Frigoribacterium sp. 9N]|nr:hypothetical protein FRIGORI9N_40066 [Frigoribacterium sp. 9N]
MRRAKRTLLPGPKQPEALVALGGVRSEKLLELGYVDFSIGYRLRHQLGQLRGELGLEIRGSGWRVVDVVAHV